MTLRTVYFDHHYGMHSAFWELINYPPEGYQFVLRDTLWDRVFHRLVVRNQLVFANFALIKLLNKFVAPPLFKARLDKVFKKQPRGIDLIFSMDHPAQWLQPSVILITWPTGLTGFDVRNLVKHKQSIARSLSSPHCRRVITWCELARKAILMNFDGAGIADKTEVVPLAMHPQKFAKPESQEKVKLLFVGSVNVHKGMVSKRLGTERFFEFDGKGGMEVLEAFLLLRERYPTLELVFRASVPPEVKRHFQGCPGIRFIDEVLPRETLEEEFKSADIFLYPTKQLTPWTVFLEAMSFELPIVTTDVYANGEIVQDGVTGLLTTGSTQVPYYWGNLLIPFGSPIHQQYMESMKVVDPLVVKGLAEKTALLIENKELRRRLGKAGRWEVEWGRHSLASRNQQLKKIFDEATDFSGPAR